MWTNLEWSTLWDFLGFREFSAKLRESQVNQDSWSPEVIRQWWKHTNQVRISPSITCLSEDPKSFLFLSAMKKTFKNLEYICRSINYLSKKKWKKTFEKDIPSTHPVAT